MYGVSLVLLEEVVRFSYLVVVEVVLIDVWNVNVNRGENIYVECVYFISFVFFDWFDFELFNGVVEFNCFNWVFLMEKMVKKYFGISNLIGKMLNFYVDDD